MTLSSVWEWLREGVWGLISAWQFWVGAAIPTAAWWTLRRRFRTTSVTIGLPFGLGSVTYDTTPADRVVAWKLYVQLVTRKAALPFDKDNDLIVETFDSLYELFGTARSLLSDLPPSEKVAHQGVATLVIGVLNNGVRPLLTRWQADFRRWWDTALGDANNHSKTPQEIQSEYPKYDQLVADLEKTNIELSKFAGQLVEVASGRSTRLTRRPRVKPRPPKALPPV